MRILYDGFIFDAQKRGGISKYTANVLQRLPDDWVPVLRTIDRKTAASITHPRLQREAMLFGQVRRPYAQVQALRRSYFAFLDKQRKYDLFHATYHFRLGSDLVRKSGCPVIATVYDMIPEIFAKELDLDGSEAKAKRAMIEAADAIICISENTKGDLQDRYRIPEARITVTPLASDLRREMAFGTEIVPRAPFVLFMGNRGPYKNFIRTLLAFSRAAASWPELQLCVVGEDLSMTEWELVHALHLTKNVQQLHFVSETHLAKLYRCSEALIYPSLYEGFGIPPLEAMTCGTVVISSCVSSLPAVVGDVAIMVDPNSVDEIAEAILSLRNLGSRRDELIRRGFARAEEFSWDKTASQTMALYKSVAR